jgi:anaerobic selenocysteine-containing dehydrogenase
MIYTVEDGRLVDVRGDPDHPFTHGSLCVKLKDFAEHHYNPDRVLYPLKRTGPKGSGQFERITWDEALQEIKSRWTSIIDEYGATAIMPHVYLGHEGILNGLTSGDAFFNKLGSSVAEKTYCESGSSTAYIMTVGAIGGTDLESYVHAKYIIVWAMNMVSTNIHGWRFILEAKKRGAKVVVIDPARTRTAKQADWYIPIRPATDGALALGMINVIMTEDLVDHDYVGKYTIGFEELKERAAEYPPEKVAEITGVPANDIRKLAREFATSQPSVIRMGVALERHHGGGQAIRAVSCLPALVGSWRHVGGGLTQMPLWDFPINWNAVCRPDWLEPGTRVVNELDLGAVLTGELGLDPPVMSLFVYNSNPVSQAPEQNKIVKGLKREDLFTVVSELFITDTARYADIVLPAAMQGEQFDVMFSWGHFHLTLNMPAIDPPGEAVPNTELFRRLAKTMGFTDPEWDRTDEEMFVDFMDWDAPAAKGITLDILKERGWARLNVGSPDERAPHAQGNFQTPSGKCELKASGAAEGNFVVPVLRSMSNEFQSGEPLDPLPTFTPPLESPASNPELAARYPLNIISPKPHAFLNSQYANEPLQQQRQGEQLVMIHPEDAAPRKIETGKYVSVFNDRGSFEGKAEVTEDIMPGVVMANLGYWSSLSRSGNTVNVITTGVHTDMGRAGAYSDNLVDVALVEESRQRPFEPAAAERRGAAPALAGTADKAP